MDTERKGEKRPLPSGGAGANEGCSSGGQEKKMKGLKCKRSGSNGKNNADAQDNADAKDNADTKEKAKKRIGSNKRDESKGKAEEKVQGRDDDGKEASKLSRKRGVYIKKQRIELTSEFSYNIDWRKIIKYAKHRGINLGTINEDQWAKIVKKLEIKTYLPVELMKSEFYGRILPNLDRIGPDYQLEPRLEEFDIYVAMLLYHSLVRVSAKHLIQLIGRLVKDNILSTKKYSSSGWLRALGKFLKHHTDAVALMADQLEYPRVVKQLAIEEYVGFSLDLA